MSKWLWLGMIFSSLVVNVQAQTTLAIDSGYTYREVIESICDDPQRLCHYYKSVSWDDSQIKEFALRRLDGAAVQEFMNFRVLFPNGFNKNNDTKYPLIVMLHGAGESGRSWAGRYDYNPDDIEYDNNGRNVIHGGTQHIAAVNRNPALSNAFPGFVIWPQVSNSGSWESGWNGGVLDQNVNNVATFIEHFIENYDVDQDRIAVHGLSNGARGVWDIAAKRNDLFAAALPMSGLARDNEAQSDILVTTPLWLFQGGTDTNPNQGSAKELIDLMVSKGGRPRYTLYPTLGHGTWNTAFAETDFFSWILAQNKKDIFVFGGEAALCAGGSLKLGFADNFLGYQWTFNGDDIPGATSRFYEATQLGTYTVKFQRRIGEQLWDESNPVNVGPKTTASLNVTLTNTGSRVLPVPGANELSLVAPQGYPVYRWYKDNVLTASINQIDNVWHLPNSAGSAGSYKVEIIEATGCLSNQSNSIEVTYGTGGAPPAPNKPVATAISSTETTITWNDVSGETAYEIWRIRFALGGYPLEGYKHIKTLPAGTTSTIDNGLRPQASYRYRVRAVNSGGGAESPESNTSTTFADNDSPSVPYDLIASDIKETEVTLSWSQSIDNDVVLGYQIYNGTQMVAEILDAAGDLTDGSPALATSITLTGLEPGKTYLYSVRARDFKIPNYSAFSQPVEVTTLGSLNGLAYKYYEFSGTMPGSAGAQLVEPRANNSFDFVNVVPTETGVINNFDIGVRNRNDQFVVAFDGYIQIDATGQRRFYTNSDDGSRLYINGTLVVNNDGAHGTTTQSGTYNFTTTGKFPIRVTFFEQGGGEGLIVRMNANTGTTNNYASAIAIPDDKLSLTSTSFVRYYYDGSGPLTDTNNWGRNTDGSGTEPGNFTAPYQYFVVNDDVTLGSQWTVSGTGSKVIVQEGRTLTLDAALIGTLEAEANATVNANHATYPSFGQLSESSTVNFAGGTTTIPVGSYGNVNINQSGTTKTFSPTNTIIKGNMIVANGVTTAGNTNNQSRILLSGDVTFSGGTPNPASALDRYSLSFTGGKKHTITHSASDLNLFSLSASFGDTIQFSHGLDPRNITLGTSLGGGLSLRSSAILLIGNEHLIISGKGSINPADESGEISIDEGNLTINSTSILNSNLYFNAAHNTAVDMNVTAGSGRINLQNLLKVKNALTLSGGELNAGGGNITLLSTETNTARIGPITAAGARITGSVNFQRYMAAEGKIYRYISSPVKGATVANLQQYMPIIGNFTGKSNYTSSAPSMFHYHLPNIIDQGWQAFPPSGGTNLDSLRRGKGYAVFLLDDVNPTTWELTGNPYQGNIAFTLTPDSNTGSSTDGWNLLGNPYASAIQWTGGTTVNKWSATGVGNFVYVRENSGTTFTWRVWNGTTGNLTDGIIAPGQSFWVQTTSASPSLIISEGAKHTTDGAFHRKASEYNNALEIALTNGSLTDRTYIQATSSGTDLYLKAEDAVKQPNSFFNLSSKSEDGILLAINVVAEEFCNKPVSLSIDNATAGNYTFNFKGLTTFYQGLKVSVKDNFLGSTHTITEDYSFDFAVTNDPLSKGSRFVLTLEKPEIASSFDLTATRVCESATSVVIRGTQPGVYYQLFKGAEAVSEKVTMDEADTIAFAIPKASVGYGSSALSVQAGFKGCSPALLGKQAVITIDTLPIPSISINNSFHLAASVADGDNYKWFHNGEVLADENGPVLIPGDVGEYTVEVSKGTCTKSSEIFNYITTGIEGHSLNRVSIYPNPFEDRITIHLNGQSTGEINLYDLVGRSHYHVKPDTTDIVTLELSGLSAGTYILNVGPEKFKVIKK